MNSFERNAKKKLTGNITWYLYERKRAPTFLQRNIRLVLAHHKRRCILRNKAKEKAIMRTPSRGRTATAVTPTSSTAEPEVWSFKDVQNLLIQRDFSSKNIYLKIDVTAIEDRLVKFRAKKGEGSETAEPPAKQARTSRVQATCSLTIWDSSTSSQAIVVKQSKKCEIHGRTRSSGERIASITMSEPFVVQVNELQQNHSKTGRMFVEPAFSMQLMLMAANETEKWPPVGMHNIGPPKLAKIIDEGGLVRYPLLVAKWQRLPQIPENQQDSLLALWASQDKQMKQPKLGLRIHANWYKTASPLTVYNENFRARSNANGISPVKDLLSPVSDSPVVFSTISTEWVFEGSAEFMDPIVFKGYICALCQCRDFKEPGEFHFHLINSHDLFKFKFSLEYKTDSTNQPVVNGVVRADVSDNYEERAANTVKDFREMTWHRPKAAFELDAYLKGDETWLGKSSKRSGNLHGHQFDAGRSNSRENVRPDTAPPLVLRSHEQVPDIAPAVRKQFKVPRAPQGTRFFRTATKRPLEESEMLSESDDEIDEEWLLQKHSDTIDSFTDTYPNEKVLMQRLDRHMLCEDLSSDLHAGEALIRFCRKNKRFLRNREMRLEFHKKAATLRLQGCLSWATIQACVAIMGPLQQNPTTSKKDSPDSPNAMDIDAKAQEAPKSTQNEPNSLLDDSVADIGVQLNSPPTPPEGSHLFGFCAICSKGILDMRENVRCSRPDCAIVDHHLQCVGLEKRLPGWVCQSCKPEDGTRRNQNPTKGPLADNPSRGHDADSADVITKLSINQATKIGPDSTSHAKQAQPRAGTKSASESPSVSRGKGTEGSIRRSAMLSMDEMMNKFEVDVRKVLLGQDRGVKPGSSSDSEDDAKDDGEVSHRSDAEWVAGSDES